MKIKTGLKVFAPAAIANFATGHNILSMAVEQPGDEILVSLDKERKGVHIEMITAFKKSLSLDPDMNSASLAGQLLLDHLNENIGIKFKLHKNTPLRSGFSSNASSAVAGVFAVNELLGRPLERYDLLAFAEEAAAKFNIKPFASQCAAILFGGVILHGNRESGTFQKLYVPHGIQLTLISPNIDLGEREKINLLEKSIDNNHRNRTEANISSMISAFYTSNFNLLAECLQDASEIDPMIKHFPYFSEINDMAVSYGAFGCGLAGLGPGMFIASPNSLIADEITNKLEGIFNKHKIDFHIWQSKINLNGAFLY